MFRRAFCGVVVLCVVTGAAGRAAVTGLVRDESGKPVANASVSCYAWDSVQKPAQTFTTDAEGLFTWSDAPDDSAFADIVMKDYAPERAVRLKSGQSTLIILTPLTSIIGTVVDDQSGKAISAFEVTGGKLSKDGKNVTWDQCRPSLVLGKDGQFEWTTPKARMKSKLRVEAEGYLLADSEPIAADGARHAMTIRLRQGMGRRTLLDAQGKPVPDADVCIFTGEDVLMLDPQRPFRSKPAEGISARTNEYGHFSLQPMAKSYVVLAITESGYVLLGQEEFEKSAKIRLLPWARLEGEVRNGTKPAANAAVQVNFIGIPEDPISVRENLMISQNLKADAAGHFVVNRILGGDVIALANGQGMRARPRPGETVHVMIGGVGRPMIGRAQVPDEIAKGGYTGNVRLELAIEMPRPSPPAEVVGKSAEGHAARFNAWLKTEAGRTYLQAWNAADARRRLFYTDLAADGSFRMSDIPPGDYELRIAVRSGAREIAGHHGGGDLVATGTASIRMPEVAGGVSDEPLDIGKVVMEARPNVAVGEVLPDFTIRGLNGKDFKLSDFRGKFLVMDIWATGCEGCLTDIDQLKGLWARYGSDPKFALVSLSLDTDTAVLADFVRTKGMIWPQGQLGEWKNDPVTKRLGIGGIPAIWLIGPDGRVESKYLRGEQMDETVETALRKSR